MSVGSLETATKRQIHDFQSGRIPDVQHDLWWPLLSSANATEGCWEMGFSCEQELSADDQSKVQFSEY